MQIRIRSHIPFKRPKIAIVGDFPREGDIAARKPFNGQEGRLLSSLLESASISKQECYLTNVFYTQPCNNDIQSYCAYKADVGGKKYKYTAVTTEKGGKYLTPLTLSDVTEYDLEQINTMKRLWGNDPVTDYFEPTKVDTVLDRLALELSIVKPNLVIALGTVASWALLRFIKITQIRGYIAESTLVPKQKVLTTYSPTDIQKWWPNRTITMVDFAKAKCESEYKEIKSSKRAVWINPTLKDLDTYWNVYLSKAKTIAFDIETAFKTITCIGFSSSKSSSIVVPFFSILKGGNYWDTDEEEIKAWEWVLKVLACSIPKVAHNGTYDLQYLYKQGLLVKNYKHDTMILQHSLQPELPKSLGFLASILTNAPPWKLLRDKTKKLTKEEE